LFKKIQRNAAASRLLEEKLFEQVALELSEGKRRNGLWAKALANCDGNEKKAKSLYIRYRVQSIKDEAEILEVVAEEKKMKIKTDPRIPTKDPEYILCHKCKFEQWIGYKKCQKCGMSFS